MPAPLCPDCEREPLVGTDPAECPYCGHTQARHRRRSRVKLALAALSGAIVGSVAVFPEVML